MKLAGCHAHDFPSTTAYQRTSSSAAFTEAQSQARKLEQEAYDLATSKVSFFQDDDSVRSPRLT